MGKRDSVLRYDGKGAAPLRFSGGGASFDSYDTEGSGQGTQAAAYRGDVVAYACINKRAMLASTIPIKVMEGEDESGVWQKHPLIKNQSSWLSAAVMYRLIFGAAYFLKHQNRAGYASTVHLLSPLFCEPDIDYSTLRLRGIRYRRGSEYAYYDRGDLVVSAAFNLGLEEVDPLSPLEVAFRQIAININVGEYARTFFANNASPAGLLTYDGGLTEEESREARNYWQRLFGGVRNAFRTAIMGGANGKWSWQKVTADPVDLAMNELSAESASKICAAFSIPPVLIGIGQASDPLSAQGTIDALNRQLISNVAQPDVQAILDSLNAQWIAKEFEGKEWRLELDLSKYIGEGLGSEERAGTARGNYAGGIWTLDEAREYLGNDPAEQAIQRDPTAALNLWQAGIVTRNEVRGIIGLSQINQDGFIWDIDPRAAPPPASPSFDFSNPTSPPVTPSPEKPPDDLPPSGGSSDLSEQANEQTDGQMDKQTPDSARTEPSPLWEASSKRELELWKDKTRRDRSAPFRSLILPPPLMDEIRTALKTDRPLVEVFKQARANLPTALQAAVSDPAFAHFVRPVRTTNGHPDSKRADGQENTPDDAETYIQEYDRIQNEIGTAWLEDYMKQIGADLLAWIQETGITDPRLVTEKMTALSTALQPDLFTAWKGTPDAPGALYKMALAGVMNGQKMLERGAAQRAAGELTLNIDWQLLSDEAMNYLMGNLPNLIKGIDETTMILIQGVIADWMIEQLPLVELITRLTPIFQDKERAKRIAATETTRIYFEGSETRWKSAGAEYMVWQTARDSLVCPVCGTLHNRTAQVGTSWVITDPQTGKQGSYRPPAHPGCRCGAKPARRSL